MKADKTNVVRICIFVLAIAFIIIGIFRGEVRELYKKAVDICFSCIGIG